MLVDTDQRTQQTVNDYARAQGIKFIAVDTAGPFARLFNDFGPVFEVLDKNGEEASEVIIKNITNEEEGLVTLLQGAKHPYEDGEFVTLSC